MTTISDRRFAADIHAHFFPLPYIESLAAHGGVDGFSVDLAGANGPILKGGGATTVLDPAFWDLERRLERMHEQGIGLHALSLTMPMAHLAAPTRGTELARIVNDAFAAAHRQYPESFVGCAALPLQDIGAAQEELRRVSRLPGIRALYFPTNVDGMELCDPSLDPLYERCEALEWPILLHPHPPVIGAARLQRHYLANLLGNPFETTVAAAYLVFGGVLDRFPRLQFVLPHAGGAAPWLHGRLEHGQRVIPGLDHAAKRPFGDYLRRFYYDTITHSPAVLKALVEMVGPDRVLLGSDYCFDMGYSRPREIVASLALSPVDRERILRYNATTLLRC